MKARREKIQFSLIVAALALALWHMPALAADRVALVIGNSAYRNVPMLRNPENDASDVADSLQRLGFAVARVKNASYDDMRRALLEFGRAARGAEMAIVFFAGHGIEAAGQNWLIPIDAELRNDIDIDHEAIGLNGLMVTVESASKLGLVILDACRNNPFAAKMNLTARTRSILRGLTMVEPSGSVLVAFAAKDGTVSADGAGRNSPFTAALLKYIETPDLEINFLFRNVRDDVIRATNREQQPFVYGSLSRDAIYLSSKSTKPALTPPPESGPMVDEVAWENLKNSNDLAALQMFIKRFPASRLRQEAEERLATLSEAHSENSAALTAGAPMPSVGASGHRFKPTKPSAAVVRSGKCFSFVGRQFCQ